MNLHPFIREVLMASAAAALLGFAGFGLTVFVVLVWFPPLVPYQVADAASVMSYPAMAGVVLAYSLLASVLFHWVLCPFQDAVVRYFDAEDESA
ncbi:MAG: hypothetical protein KF740_01415 [Ramlibacter sp.]|nr:hypothetical protein [Ramlibacter sp.]